MIPIETAQKSNFSYNNFNQEGLDALQKYYKNYKSNERDYIKKRTIIEINHDPNNQEIDKPNSPINKKSNIVEINIPSEPDYPIINKPNSPINKKSNIVEINIPSEPNYPIINKPNVIEINSPINKPNNFNRPSNKPNVIEINSPINKPNNFNRPSNKPNVIEINSPINKPSNNPYFPIINKPNVIEINSPINRPSNNPYFPIINKPNVIEINSPINKPNNFNNPYLPIINKPNNFNTPSTLDKPSKLNQENYPKNNQKMYRKFSCNNNICTYNNKCFTFNKDAVYYSIPNWINLITNLELDTELRLYYNKTTNFNSYVSLKSYFEEVYAKIKRNPSELLSTIRFLYFMYRFFLNNFKYTPVCEHVPENTPCFNNICSVNHFKYNDPTNISKYKSGVCQGFSALYCILCKDFDIVCYTNIGDGHAWNIVEIDSNEFYIIDPTNRPRYFMIPPTLYSYRPVNQISLLEDDSVLNNTKDYKIGMKFFESPSY